MGESLNSNKADFAPFLTNDGNTLLFASYGHKGYGSADIFMAHRTGDGWTEWTEPENLGEVINSKFEETFVSIDPSFDYLYYDSYPPAAENRNIWRATLSDDIKEKIIAARDRNKKEKQPIKETEEIIQKPQTEESITQADSNKEKEEVIAENTSTNTSEEEATALQSATAENSQLEAVTIDQEMDYAKEQERNNQGFLSQLGEKFGFGGEEEAFQLYDAGAKGQKINRNVYFKFNSDRLQIKFNGLLDEISADLQSNSQVKILLEGHTDAIGGENANKDLSCNRANAIKDALLQRGISKYRIEISCEGKERPIATNDDEFEGRELNRRVEFYLF
jgi:outer membrane protein OmpA-like peptidoglycan-associated protein